MYCSCEGQKNLSAKWSDYTIAIWWEDIGQTWDPNIPIAIWSYPPAQSHPVQRSALQRSATWNLDRLSFPDGLPREACQCQQSYLLHKYQLKDCTWTSPNQMTQHDPTMLWDVVLSVQPLRGVCSSKEQGSTVGDHIQIRLIGWVIVVVQQSGSTMGQSFGWWFHTSSYHEYPLSISSQSYSIVHPYFWKFRLALFDRLTNSHGFSWALVLT